MDSGISKLVQDITTIKISRATKARIDNLRSYRRESYEEIMEKIFNVLNICRINPEQAQERLISIDRERKRNLKGSDAKNQEARKDKVEIKNNGNKSVSQVNKLIDKLRR